MIVLTRAREHTESTYTISDTVRGNLRTYVSFIDIGGNDSKKRKEKKFRSNLYTNDQVHKIGRQPIAQKETRIYRQKSYKSGQ